MKIRRISAVLAVVFAAAMLFSTAPADHLYASIGTSARLIKNEYRNILSFFGERTYSTEERGMMPSSPADKPSSPELISKPHTEVIPSPFCSPDRQSTVTSVGSSELCSLGGEKLSEEGKYGYTAIPLFVDRGVAGITRMLTAHGIIYTTVTRKSTAPAGEVFAMRYAGISDPGGYYVNPNIAVTLYVSAPKEASAAIGENNAVYLTFDDGPSAAHTEAILDILDTYGIKAIFFTLGTALENNPELASEAVGRGHILGCHTMTHVYDDIYSSPEALEKEIDEWETVAGECGIDLGGQKYFRFPGGSVSARLTKDKLSAMKSMLDRRGYKVYDWNVSANDAVLYLAPDGVTSYDYIKQSFVDSLELCLRSNANKSDEPIIILMHEPTDETPELLTWMIEYLRSANLSFGNPENLASSWTFPEQ